MGVSTDAILVFGIDLGDEDEGDEKLAALIKLHDDCELEDARVDIVKHCSGDSSMIILAVSKTERRSRRGYPKVISPMSLTITDSQIRALAEFCKEHGIEWRDPQWLLCSMWW